MKHACERSLELDHDRIPSFQSSDLKNHQKTATNIIEICHSPIRIFEILETNLSTITDIIIRTNLFRQSHHLGDHIHTSFLHNPVE